MRAWHNRGAMKGTATHQITSLLHAIGRGEGEAHDRLMTLVYEDLRAQAAHFIGNEPAGHTLQRTALVHEAYLRLVDIEAMEWSDRRHFFAVAATCMRRILIDHARGKQARKRGRGSRPIPLDQVEVFAPERSEELLALDEALDGLAATDARKARVAELRLFSGLEHKEIGEVIGISLATAERDWRLARAWLHRELTGDLP